MKDYGPVKLDENESNLAKIEAQIQEASDSIVSLLKRKNRSYGNSLDRATFTFANEFNKENLTNVQFGMCCRIDDKLARIRNSGLNKDTYDTLDDLIGYLLRLKITFNDR
jgi:hypothetical protein